MSRDFFFFFCQHAMIARKCAQRALLKLSRSSCGQGPEAPVSEGRARARARARAKYKTRDQGRATSTQNFERQLLFRYWEKFFSFSFPVTCCFWKNRSCPCCWDMTTTCPNLAISSFFSSFPADPPGLQAYRTIWNWKWTHFLCLHGRVSLNVASYEGAVSCFTCMSRTFFFFLDF